MDNTCFGIQPSEENGPLTVVPALLFGGALRLVAHMSYPTGEESVECSDSIFSLVQLKEGV